MKKVYKLKTSVVCVNNDSLLTFIGIDPLTKERRVFHPGGKPENNESLSECAQRETFEETGYDVCVDNKATVVKQYDFVWNGITYYCETHFYRGHLLDCHQSEVCDKEYNKGVYWCPLSELSQHLNYSLPVLEATKEILLL